MFKSKEEPAEQNRQDHALNPSKQTLLGTSQASSLEPPLSADSDVSHRISPHMQARLLEHGYRPIGELRLDLTHDIVVNGKRLRRLDRVGRLNETSVLIPNRHLVFC